MINYNIIKFIIKSEFIDEVLEWWDTNLETLSLSNGGDNRGSFTSFLERISGHWLPMVEHTLWESSARGGGSQGLGETEGFSDWEVGLHLHEWGSGNWLFSNNDTSSLGKTLVNWTNAIIRGLDLTEEDWLLESWCGDELTSVQDSSGSWDDLTSSSMDGIGVEGDIMDIESASSHVLVAHNTFFGGPLEGSFHGVLDFVKELDTLSGIDDDVWTAVVWSIAPNLTGVGLVPLVGLDEVSDLLLGIGLWTTGLILDLEGKFLSKWLGSHEESVMLVWGLGEAHLTGFLGDGFLVGNDWVTLNDIALGVFFDQILEADLDMEFTTSGNDMLTRFLGVTEDEWIRLGEFLQTFNKFWEIGGVLDGNGDSDDWGDRVLHDSDVMSIFGGSDGTLLEDVLIDTNKSDGVTTWYIWDGFDLTSHHNNGSLDVLDVEVSLGSGNVVWTLDSDFLSGGNGSSENSSESVESSLVVGGDHLGDEDGEWSVLIAVTNGVESSITLWSFIKVGGSVLLGLDWTWELEDDHFKKGLSGVDPLLEDVLHEVLTLEFSLLRHELDAEVIEHLVDLLGLSVHGGSAESDDWLHDEGDESSLELLVVIGPGVVLPLLGLLVEEVFAPKLVHHLLSGDSEFLGVDSGESGEGEGPSEKSGTHSAGTVLWVNLLRFSHVFALVGGDDNVDVLNNSVEFLEHSLTINLELEDTSINLVDHQAWLDLLGEGLSEDGLGLDGDTFDVIDDDEGTIGDSEGSSDF